MSLRECIHTGASEIQYLKKNIALNFHNAFFIFSHMCMVVCKFSSIKFRFKNMPKPDGILPDMTQFVMCC